MTPREVTEFKRALRHAVADYIAAAGCGCCGDRDDRDAAEAKIAKLLNVPRHDDNSGFDFRRYQTGAR